MQKSVESLALGFFITLRRFSKTDSIKVGMLDFPTYCTT